MVKEHTLGETSRSLYERVKEHDGVMESLRKDSNMVNTGLTPLQPCIKPHPSDSSVLVSIKIA